jgi:hypothetical protein
VPAAHSRRPDDVPIRRFDGTHADSLGSPASRPQRADVLGGSACQAYGDARAMCGPSVPAQAALKGADLHAGGGTEARGRSSPWRTMLDAARPSAGMTFLVSAVRSGGARVGESGLPRAAGATGVFALEAKPISARTVRAEWRARRPGSTCRTSS